MHIGLECKEGRLASKDFRFKNTKTHRNPQNDLKPSCKYMHLLVTTHNGTMIVEERVPLGYEVYQLPSSMNL